MGLFKDSGLEAIREKNPITKEFVAMISNTLNSEFSEDEIEGSYALTTKDKVIAITSPDVMPFVSEGQTEISFEDIKSRQGDLMGLGETWVNRDLLIKIIEALETYEVKYKIFIDPGASFPLLVMTPDGNITIAPMETFRQI